MWVLLEEFREVSIMLLSFTPWIIYWISIDFEFGFGVFFSLATSFIIIAPQIKRREYYLMDVFNFMYFIAASVGTLLDVGIFVEYGGFLGYLALSLMAALSILVKSPFTLKAAKKDWPEAYWRDRSFVLINNVISAVWMAVLQLTR
ncbi:MAG: hypothetical protein RMH84_00945 [Sulfolobales archaeon]|nr:hypothetical protein [Sulfolobales archaeon]MCX8208823.1 hypothetical protein [Sulfolobales archaeon]MDW8010152.1 hypothetical protein [Sulfolobales archaeon]